MSDLQTQLRNYFASENSQLADKGPLERPADLPANASAVQRQQHADQMEAYASRLINRSAPLTQGEKTFLASEIASSLKELGY